MINQIIAITLKEIKVLMRDRGEIVALFIIPIAFILVMTTALQGVFDQGTNNHPVSLLVVNQDRGAIGAKVIADLRGVSGLSLVETQNSQPLTRQMAEDLIKAHTYSLALVFPVDFSASILGAAGNPQAAKATVSFVADPAVGSQLLSPVRGMVEGYVEREAYLAQTPRELAQGFDRLAAGLPSMQAAQVQALGRQFTASYNSGQGNTSQNLGVAFEVLAPAGFQAEHTPTSTEQNVPGYTIYGVFFIMTTIATGLFREKDQGTFRRLQAAPVSRPALLIGKMLPYYLINLLQIALMFTVGVVIFHMSLGDDPLALILVSLATAAAANGLGLLLAALGKSQEQAGNLGTVLSIVLAALGGMMVPRSVMPAFMQKLSLVTPHAWALTGFQDIIVRGLGVNAVLPAVAMLMGFALVFWILAIWRFRFD